MMSTSRSGKQENAARKRCHAGFTLLEVLISVSIISIVLVSALRLQGQSVTMNESARFYSTAPFLAQQKMAEVRFDPQRFMGTDSGRFDEMPEHYSWRVAVESLAIAGMENDELPVYDVAVTIHSAVTKSSYVLQSYFHAFDEDI